MFAFLGLFYKIFIYLLLILKIMKKLFLFTFIFTLFFLWNNVYANYTQDDLNLATTKLEALEWSENYKSILDNFLSNYENDIIILDKIKTKLDILLIDLEPKTDRKSKLLKIIFDYLRVKVYLRLDILLEEESQIKQEENTQDDIIKETDKEEVEKWVYPGFSDTYNDEIKTILAWTETYIYAWGVWALYEKADAWKVIFYISWNNISDLQYSIEKSYLYVEGLIVKTAFPSDINIINSTKASITFDNIENFIIPDDKNIDFRLSIKTNTIWYQKVWKSMKDLIVSDVDFDDVTWLTSDQEINSINISDFSAENFTISPAILTASAINTLDTSYQVKLNINSDLWSNTKETSNSSPSVELNTLNLSVLWNDASSATYDLYNSSDSSDMISWVYNSWVVEFDLSSLSSNHKTIWEWTWEDYYIKISWIDTWIFMELLRDWIIYNVLWISNSSDININLKNSINLGYRDF